MMWGETEEEDHDWTNRRSSGTSVSLSLQLCWVEKPLWRSGHVSLWSAENKVLMATDSDSCDLQLFGWACTHEHLGPVFGWWQWNLMCLLDLQVRGVCVVRCSGQFYCSLRSLYLDFNASIYKQFSISHHFDGNTGTHTMLYQQLNHSFTLGSNFPLFWCEH